MSKQLIELLKLTFICGLEKKKLHANKNSIHEYKREMSSFFFFLQILNATDRSNRVRNLLIPTAKIRLRLNFVSLFNFFGIFYFLPWRFGKLSLHDTFRAVLLTGRVSPYTIIIKRVVSFFGILKCSKCI